MIDADPGNRFVDHVAQRGRLTDEMSECLPLARPRLVPQHERQSWKNDISHAKQMAPIKGHDCRVVGNDGRCNYRSILTFDNTRDIEHVVIDQFDELPIDQGEHLLEEWDCLRCLPGQVSHNLINDVVASDWLDLSSIGAKKKLARSSGFGGQRCEEDAGIKNDGEHDLDRDVILH